MTISIRHLLQTSVVVLSIALASCDSSSNNGQAAGGAHNTASGGSQNQSVPVSDGSNKTGDTAQNGNGDNDTFEVPPELLAGSYHIDCEASTGSIDARSELGTRANPMTELSQINAVKLEPGNKVLFKRGSTCYGRFKPAAGSTGTEGKPIVLTAYGEKELGRPVIAAGCRVVEQQGVEYPPKEHKLSDFTTAPNKAFPAEQLFANIVPYETICVGDEKPNNLAAIHLLNTEYWEIDTVELTNDANSSGNRIGLYVQLEDFGTGHHYQVRDVYVHHVRGRVKDSDGIPNTYKTTGGILFSVTRDNEVYLTPQKRTTFDGILVENSEIFEVDPIGLATRSAWMCRTNGAPCGDYEPYRGNIAMVVWETARNDYTPMKNVVFRQNKIHNIGGDGLIIRTADKPLIEGNLFLDTWLRVPGNSAAAWAINTDGALFQYNEVARTRLQHYAQTNNDGMAFDADLGARETKFINNLSYENQGGVLLLCGCGFDNMDGPAKAVGTIFSKNLSVSDGDKLVFGAGSLGTVVSDNVFITRANTPLKGVFRLDGKAINQFQLANNKFYSEKPDVPLLFQGEENRTDVRWQDVFFGANQFIGFEVKPNTFSSQRYKQSPGVANDTFAPFNADTNFETIVRDWMAASEFEKFRYKPLAL